MSDAPDSPGAATQGAEGGHNQFLNPTRWPVEGDPDAGAAWASYRREALAVVALYGGKPE